MLRLCFFSLLPYSFVLGFVFIDRFLLILNSQGKVYKNKNMFVLFVQHERLQSNLAYLARFSENI